MVTEAQMPHVTRGVVGALVLVPEHRCSDEVMLSPDLCTDADNKNACCFRSDQKSPLEL